ncbi:MAG: methionine biosynthesis protein MetW [Hyphomicrobium sp.]|uniref:class I SAM-dependent methyltransferase n=1 Tax=Hyphomicrobium sp. TaxID=82 RepID=UPI0039E3AE4F
MNLMAATHKLAVLDRRVRVLADQLADIIPSGSSILDVGCGDGSVDRLILEKRPDLAIEGIDIMIRPKTSIPVKAFDGQRIPHDDNTFDYGMLVDVLHHTNDPGLILQEVLRVSRSGIIIKDHLADDVLARPTLRFMDWVGNAPHGVVLPYNYLGKAEWQELFHKLAVKSVVWEDKLAIYPAPFTLIFDRGLHFITRLEKR